MVLHEGLHVGPYRVIELAGAGGMGEVWRAHDERLGRDVALKLLHERLDDDAARRRLLAEARAVSALHHPHIVTLHDVTRWNGRDVLVMEYAEGTPLSRHIRPGGLAWRDALKLAIPVADALAAAHRAGLVHRDLKPANVLVTPEGLSKVLDFGLAEKAAPSVEGTTAPTLVDLQGGFTGTPMYMSPEQARGEHVDHRSDIFSFGLLLHEMLTGRRAFERKTVPETLSAVLHDVVHIPRTLPPPLVRLLERCLRKDVSRRMRDLEDVRLELEEVLADADDTISPSRSPGAVATSGWSRSWFLVLLLPLAAVAGWALKAPASAPAWEVLPLTAFPGLEQMPALSPDGNHVAFMWDGPDGTNSDVYVQRLGGATPPLRLTTHASMDAAPTWSPDGSQIAFLRVHAEYSELMIVAALGGAERRAARLDGSLRSNIQLPPGRIDWSPRGDVIALASPTLSVVDLRTSEHVRFPPTPGPGFDRNPAFSPDGSKLAYAKGEGVYAQLWQLPLDHAGRAAGQPVRLSPEFRNYMGVTWKDDESLIAAAGWIGSVVNLFVLGRDQRLQPLPIESVAAWHPDYSPTHRRLVYQRRIIDSDLARVSLDGAGHPPVPLIASTYQDREGQYSPDGTRIVFISTRSGQPAVWRANSDGTNQVLIASVNLGVPGSPRWTPDGQHVVFDASAPATGSDIFMAPAEGGSARPLVAGDDHEIRGCLSSDGQLVYFETDEEIWKAPVAGGARVLVARRPATRPVESADGRTVFFSRNNEVWRVPTAGGAEELVRPDVVAPRWTVRGSVLYELRVTEGQGIAVLGHDLVSKKTRTLYRSEGPQRFFASNQLDVSPDGRSALISPVARDESDLVVVHNVH